MQKYPTYKPSNIDWIGEIPSHWDATKISYYCEVKDGTHDTPNYIDEGYPLITQKDISNGKLDFSKAKNISFDDYQSINKRSNVTQNDILMSMIGSIGNATIVDTDAKFSIKNLCLLKSSESSQDTKWIYFYFNSSILLHELEINSRGGVQGFVSLDVLRNVKFIKPPLSEQQAIVAYLDEKTTLIDELIAKKQSKIALLKEQRTALINQAVTKGLNAEVSFKDSKIEWIGEIPEHWKCVKVGHYTIIIRGASPRPAGDPSLFDGDFIHWITVKEVTNGSGKFVTSTDTYLTEEGMKQSRIIEPETLVISNSGATLGVPKILKIRGCINDGSVAFPKISEKLFRDFLYYFFTSQTELLREQQSGYGQPNLNTDLIANIRFPLPPIEEQKEIVAFLDNQLDLIDKNIELESQKIEKLKEYRQSLISNIVTGKIKVA